MTSLLSEDVERIAEGLTKAQREFLTSYPNRGGRPHGLVARGLLAYRWGFSSTHGYTFTDKGARVRTHLLGEKK